MKGHNIVFWDIIHNKETSSIVLKLLKIRGWILGVKETSTPTLKLLKKRGGRFRACEEVSDHAKS